jgi:hypothetical protein
MGRSAHRRRAPELQHAGREMIRLHIEGNQWQHVVVALKAPPHEPQVNKGINEALHYCLGWPAMAAFTRGTACLM